MFHHFFEDKECAKIGASITIEEVNHTLSICSKDKIPGPNGWTVDLYFHFFDLLGHDITEAIDETRQTCLVPGDLNSTYITLISKNDKSVMFNDYCLISLCNMLYKIIMKNYCYPIEALFRQVYF